MTSQHRSDASQPAENRDESQESKYDWSTTRVLKAVNRKQAASPATPAPNEIPPSASPQPTAVTRAAPRWEAAVVPPDPEAAASSHPMSAGSPAVAPDHAAWLAEPQEAEPRAEAADESGTAAPVIGTAAVSQARQGNGNAPDEAGESKSAQAPATGTASVPTPPNDRVTAETASPAGEPAAAVPMFSAPQGNAALSREPGETDAAGLRPEAAPVPGAGRGDLDPETVGELLERIRRSGWRGFSGVDEDTALRRLGVLTTDDRVTLAGVVALGRYPQQFFPQLNVNLVVYSGDRIADSRLIDGAVGHLVNDSVAAVAGQAPPRRDATGADVPQFSSDTLQEALTNALSHRDYGAMARGAPVRVALHADRLTITNPGVPYGITSRELEAAERDDLVWSRNPSLVRILSYLTLPLARQPMFANRGEGAARIRRDAAAHRFTIADGRFQLTLYRA